MSRTVASTRAAPLGGRGRAAAPALVLVVLVAGTGTAAVAATSLGLMPLVGEPRLSGRAWTGSADDLLLGLRESLLITVPATLLAALVGLLLASAVLEARGRTGGLVRVVAVAVLSVPHLVGAASWALLLADGGVAWRLSGLAAAAWPPLVAGPWPVATVLELAWKESAFVALVVVAALRRGHEQRREAAAVLGAGPVQRWARVLAPTALPSLAAASVVVAVYTVGSYEVAWLLGRSYPEPLPVLAYRVFGSVDLAARPAAAAAATAGAGLALAVAVLALIPAAFAARLRDTR